MLATVSDGDLASVRSREFARLDRVGLTYADYTGAALYPESLIARHARYLSENVLGNPHSDSGPSLASTAHVKAAKRRTLQHLDADPALYDVVFTPNTSGAIRILAEAFPFDHGSRLVLTADNHNSVNGLRVAALLRNGEVDYVPLSEQLVSEDPRARLQPARAPSLFAFPAQSNFSGVQHPLTWITDAQAAGYRVLLDAAAYLPTHALSLTRHPADFVALSFYKLFGYPTGVGALVARHDALRMLRRKYFAGGTVDFVSVQNRLERARPGSDAFEDGTTNFLSLSAVIDGLDWLKGLGIDHVRRHVESLADQFRSGLASRPQRVLVYGPSAGDARSNVVVFNLKRRGQIVPYEAVEAAARAQGIAVRGGCFCNPGAAERAFNVQADRARACLQEPQFTIARLRDHLGGGTVGAVRASFGVANNLADVSRLLSFFCDDEIVNLT